MILPWLILIPFISGLLGWHFEFRNKKFAKIIALISIITLIILTIIILINENYIFTQEKNFKYKFNYPWIENFGINFYLSLDGLSLIMIILTELLGLTAILASWHEKRKYNGAFYLNIMILLGSTIGIFLSTDMFLFFLFWEIIAIPMYFLMSLWGNKKYNLKNKLNCANKFFIYSQTSGILMLIGILGLSYINKYQKGFWTFNYDLLSDISMPYHIEYMLMLIFFVSFAIKIPVFFLHEWLIDLHCKSPNSGIVDIIGILIKTAVYGLLKFNLVLFPYSSNNFSYIPIFLGIISIFYFSWVAFGQTDIKKLIAYASISHMGYILIGIYSNTKLSLQGVIIQIFSNSLSTAALFILCGFIYKITNTRNIKEIGGLWNYINWLPGMMLFFSLANLGIPGTGNFIGEFMILSGGIKNNPFIVFIATCGLLFSTIYSLNMIQKIFFGKTILLKKTLPSLKKIEIMTLLILMFFIIIVGLYPQIILNISNNSINNIYQYTLKNH